MEELLPHATWGRFILLGLLLLLGYWLVRLALRWLRRATLPHPLRWLPRVGRAVYALYEPVAVLLLLGTFVLINPILHGSLLLLLAILSFSQLKNYVVGRILELSGKLQEGAQLRAGQADGIVRRLGHTGIYLQDSEGLHFINYHRLTEEGYILFSKGQVGGFCHLRIRPDEKNTEKQHALRLMDLLAKTPYLDWNHGPAITATDKAVSEMEAKVFLREEKQLPELLSLIQEWGYHCEIATKTPTQA